MNIIPPSAERLKANPKIVALYMSALDWKFLFCIRLKASLLSAKYKLKLLVNDLKALPQVLAIVLLLVLLLICVIVSYLLKDNSTAAYWCSLLQNVAAGLITGLVLYFLSLIRSVYITKLTSYLELCQEINIKLKNILCLPQPTLSVPLLESSITQIQDQYLEIFPYFSPFVGERDVWFQHRVDLLRRDYKKHILRNDIVSYLTTANP